MGSTGQRKCGTPPRATYTPAQVDAYFDTIGLPAKYRNSGIATSKDAASASPDEAFSFLSALIKYQLTGIPWENLELHYSSHHTISLDPLHVFHKIVERKHGRGGYCMENTLLLATIARSLGYDIMTTGARVNTSIEPVSATPSWKGPSFNGWNHMVSIITIGGKKYLVDVGVGSHGPSYPVPLEDGFQAVNVKPNFEISLTRQHPDDNTHKQAEEQKMWFYSIRFKQDMDWLIAYAFSELEFLPVDYETMNFFVSKSPKSWFTFHVVCLKWLMDRDTEEIVGDMTLFDGMLNERRKGVGKDLATVKSEEERIRVLEENFGVKLSGPEKAGIEGMVTQLSSTIFMVPSEAATLKKRHPSRNTRPSTLAHVFPLDRPSNHNRLRTAMSNITTIQETPNLKPSSVVFTSGSTIPISAPASNVFSIITDHARYAQWNTWTPSLTTEDDQPLHLHTKGTLTARMQKQGREYKIPIEITELENGPDRYVLARRASLMPSWFAVAERVHVVTKTGERECEVRQWESTAGWGAYVLLWILGVRAELDEANLRYVGELREFAERD